jgi:hypothetical protein
VKNCEYLFPKLLSIFLLFATVGLLKAQENNLVPFYEDIDPFLATPADGAKKFINVMVIRFLPTKDGINLDVSKVPGFHSLDEVTLEEMKHQINQLDKRIKFMLEEATKFRGYKNPDAEPYLGYRVIKYITFFEAPPLSGIEKYDINGYPLYGWDYDKIFKKLGMEYYVNDLNVQQIWIWYGGLDTGFPSYDHDIHNTSDFQILWESNMSSPLTGDISNSNRNPSDLPLYEKTYIVYGHNFRRTQAEAVGHNHGHQIEQKLIYVNEKQDGDKELFWGKFVGYPFGVPKTGRCGWTHMPPNTIENYDYHNKTLVESDIEDWYPDGHGDKKPVNVDTWAKLEYDWPDPQQPVPQKTESQYYLYWMQSIPGYENSIPYGDEYVLTNWWEFIANWDELMISNVGLYKEYFPIIVNAKGSQASGVYAHFTVVVDGEEIGDTFVKSNYEPYTFPIFVDPALVKEVRVVFDNDAVIDGKDRNLYVKSIEINGKEISASGGKVIYTRGDGSEYPYDGIMPWNGGLIFEILEGAGVCEGEIRLSSQEQVDACNCRIITGGLTISGEEISNIDALSSLTNVGSLYITNTALSNINGLNSLTKVTGPVSIQSNPMLSDLDGLSNLSIIGESGGMLIIWGNNKLQNLDGLKNLLYLGGGLDILKNPELSSCCGLYTLLHSGFIGGPINISENDTGCTEDDILANGPCPIICEGDVTLTSQAEVDAFNCAKIIGDLTISGPDITNLDAVSHFTYIGGSLRIVGNENLTNLNGLSNLKSIGESLEVLDNPSLTSIEGLEKIVSINSDLRISNNKSLASLKGLQNLKSVEANFDIVGNDALLNLNNLSSLSATYYLKIKDNKSLLNLDGLQSLVPESETWIIIDGNPVLADIQALSSIRSITGLYILDNDVLTNLNGLSSLCAVEQILDITGNARLHDLHGLTSLKKVGEVGVHGELAIIGNESLSDINSLSTLNAIDGDLLIASNPMLCQCCGIFSLLSDEKITGYIGIVDNGDGCTETDILANGPCDGDGVLIVNARGSAAGGNYAHFTVLVDGEEIGDAFTTSNYESYVFPFHVNPSDIQEVRVVFDNDAVIDDDDRNLRVQSIEIDGMLYPAPEDNVTYVRANGSEYPYHGTMWWGGDLVFNLSENDWIFSVLVGVTERTSDYYGGYENVNQLVMDQFMTINAKFNDPDVFSARLNFGVDEVYVFPGDIYSEIFKSHPDHDYKVVIDGYPDHGGGWYGSYNTVYHSWSIDSYGGPFGDTATDGLTHEFGHSRGAIDLYASKVESINNPVNGEEYDIPFSSIMNYPYGIDVWDEHSINLINMNGGEVISNLDYIHNSFPPMIIIIVQDQFGIPLNNVKVNMYPVKWYSESVGSSPRLTMYTNNDGNAELIENPFEPGDSNDPWEIKYCNFLIEATYSGFSQYKWLPLFEVQNHYFKYPDEPYFQNFKFSNSFQSIIVHAKGSEAGGAYAHFTVLVDDEEIGDAFTTSSNEPYVFPLNFAPGMIHEVTVVFDNDAVINGKDRNLYVQGIEIDGLVLTAPGENVTYIRGDGSEYPYHGTMWWRGDLVFDLSGLDGSSRRSAVTEALDENWNIENQLQMNLYPNPADRVLNVELMNAPIGQTRLLLYDIYGNMILEEKLSVEQRIQLESLDISQIKKGVYFIKMVTKDHQHSLEKILVH